MNAGTVALHDDGAVILNADGTVGVRQNEDDPACCCGGEMCFYIATLCPCDADEFPEAPPEVLVSCPEVHNITNGTPSSPEPITHFAFKEVGSGGGGVDKPCYEVGTDSPQWNPPPGTDPVPPPRINIDPNTVRPSCEFCCSDEEPVLCWSHVLICDSGAGGKCPGGGLPLTYIFLGPQEKGECPTIPDYIWLYGEHCVYASGIVHELPPGAVVITPADQYETCAECCGDDDPPCSDCSGCLPTKTYIVGGGQITGGGTPPCSCDPKPTAYFEYDQAVIPLARVGNTCTYNGTGTVHYKFWADGELIEEGNQPISAGVNCVVFPGNVRRWRGGDSLWGFQAYSPAVNSPCPPNGAYNQDITPQPWPPNCCNYPLLFTIA